MHPIGSTAILLRHNYIPQQFHLSSPERLQPHCTTGTQSTLTIQYVGWFEVVTLTKHKHVLDSEFHITKEQEVACGISSVRISHTANP